MCDTCWCGTGCSSRLLTVQIHHGEIAAAGDNGAAHDEPEAARGARQHNQLAGERERGRRQDSRRGGCGGGGGGRRAGGGDGKAPGEDEASAAISRPDGEPRSRADGKHGGMGRNSKRQEKEEWREKTTELRTATPSTMRPFSWRLFSGPGSAGTSQGGGGWALASIVHHWGRARSVGVGCLVAKCRLGEGVCRHVSPDTAALGAGSPSTLETQRRPTAQSSRHEATLAGRRRAGRNETGPPGDRRPGTGLAHRGGAYSPQQDSLAAHSVGREERSSEAGTGGCRTSTKYFDKERDFDGHHRGRDTFGIFAANVSGMLIRDAWAEDFEIHQIQLT